MNMMELHLMSVMEMEEIVVEQQVVEHVPLDYTILVVGLRFPE
jgi:hypothetical protein